MGKKKHKHKWKTCPIPLGFLNSGFIAKLTEEVKEMSSNWKEDRFKLFFCRCELYKLSKIKEEK